VGEMAGRPEGDKAAPDLNPNCNTYFTTTVAPNFTRL
jgi:hypothetical protein